MIFQQTKHSRQAGVTLLLSILILSALVAISFSFASIILIEIKSSGDVVKTEPAFYAVQGVVEQTIFKVKRNVPNDPYNFDFGGCNFDKDVNDVGVRVATVNIVGLTAGICGVNPKATVDVIVPPTPNFGDPASTQNVYSLYDPENPYTNQFCIGGTGSNCSGGRLYDSAYNNIEFRYLDSPGASTTIYMCTADKECYPDDWDAIAVLSSHSANTRCIQFYDPDRVQNAPGCGMGGKILANEAYQFFLVNSSNTQNGGVEIFSQGPDPENNPGDPTAVVDKGLPVFGQSAVNVTATSAGLTRKYQVYIPNE